MSFRDLDRGHLARRYRLVPQFADYDSNELYLRPYLTFCSRPGLQGGVFSTDALGFRRSASTEGYVDSPRWLLQGGGGLALGGSFVFGVGASTDDATLPSQLAHLLGSPQLNLGVCAGNSLQELIAAIPFLDRASTVLVCSGINNVFASLQSLGHNELYGPLFFEGALATLGTVPIPDLANGVRPATGQKATDAARVVPSAAEDADLSARLDAALQRQLRDLGVIAGAVRDRAQLLFALQPFADPVQRRLTPEEDELMSLHLERQGDWIRARDFVARNWAAYARRLGDGCARLGVQFLDLRAAAFTGWSFYDRVHMTDDGYRQAAEMVAEALCSGR